MRHGQVAALVAALGLAAVVALLLLAGAGTLRDLDRASPARPDSPAGSPPEPAIGSVPARNSGTPGLAAAPGDPPPEAPAPSEPSAGQTTLVVTVVEFDDPRLPVPFARVAVAQPGAWLRATASSSGVARITLPKAGAYVAKVTAEGHAPRGHEFVAEPGRAIEWTAALRNGVALDGRVVRASDGSPIQGATVRFVTGDRFKMPSLSDPDDVVLAGVDGRFHVPGVPSDGQAAVRAYAPGFHFTTTYLDGWDLPPDGVLLRLKPGGRVVGTVRDPDGKHVPAAKVWLLSADWVRGNINSGERYGIETMTRDDGTYSVEGIAFDTHHVVWAEAPPLAQSVSVYDVAATASAPEARADPILRRPSTLVVRVRDRDGRPGEDVEVQLEAPWEEHSARVDAQGICRFEGLCPRRFEVKAASLLYPAVSQGVDLTEGTTTEVSLTLDRGARIEGVVVGDGDTPIPGASLCIWEVEGGRRLRYPPLLWRSDERGAFRRGDLQPGEYEVSASTDEVRALPVRVRAPASDVRIRCSVLGKATFRLLRPDGMPYQNGFHVAVDAADGHSTREVRSVAPDGTTTVDGLVAGSVTLDLRPRDYPRLRIEGTLRPGDTLDLGTHTLPQGISLSGIVRDARGEPYPGARVSMQDHPDVSTDLNGAFSFLHLERGFHEVGVRAAGFVTVTRWVQVEADGPAPEFTLVRGGLLRGALNIESGDSLGGPVTAEWAGSGPKPETEHFSEYMSSDGRFTLHLPPGRWRLTWRRDSQNVHLGEWTLAEGETKDVEP